MEYFDTHNKGKSQVQSRKFASYNTHTPHHTFSGNIHKPQIPPENYACPPAMQKHARKHVTITCSDHSCLIDATLPNGEVLPALIDSGSTYSLLSRQAVQQYSYFANHTTLHKLQHPVELQTGSGTPVLCKYEVKFHIFLQEQHVQLKCLIIEPITAFPLVIGYDLLAAHKFTMDFHARQLHLTKSKLLIRPCATYELKPHVPTIVWTHCGIPGLLNHLNFSLCLHGKFKNMVDQNLIISLHKGKTPIQITNNTNTPIHITSNTVLGCLRYDRNPIPPSTNQWPNHHKTSAMFHNHTKHTLKITTANKTNMPFHYPDNKHVDKRLVKNQNNSYIHDPARQAIKIKKAKLYPHLDDDDRSLYFADEELINEKINLSRSRLSHEGKRRLMHILHDNAKSFSLHSDIGHCVDSEVSFSLKDDTPFFIKPFPCSQQEKEMIQSKIDTLLKQGIIAPCTSQYVSPAMLIKKYNDKGELKLRLVQDYRLVNSRIKRDQFAQCLISDALHHIGYINARYISIMDVAGAYYCLNLAKHCQKYTAFCPFHILQKYYKKFHNIANT